MGRSSTPDGGGLLPLPPCASPPTPPSLATPSTTQLGLRGPLELEQEWQVTRGEGFFYLGLWSSCRTLRCGFTCQNSGSHISIQTGQMGRPECAEQGGKIWGASNHFWIQRLNNVGHWIEPGSFIYCIIHPPLQVSIVLRFTWSSFKIIDFLSVCTVLTSLFQYQIFWLLHFCHLWV